MKNKILGTIGVIWGGAVMVSGLVGYQELNIGSAIWAVVMVIAGLYYLLKTEISLFTNIANSHFVFEHGLNRTKTY